MCGAGDTGAGVCERGGGREAEGMVARMQRHRHAQAAALGARGARHDRRGARAQEAAGEGKVD